MSAAVASPNGALTITGDEARAVRFKWSLNIEQMAKLVGVSTTTVYRWERFSCNSITLDPGNQSVIRLMREVAVSLQNNKLAFSSLKAFVASYLNGGGSFSSLYAVAAIVAAHSESGLPRHVEASASS